MFSIDWLSLVLPLAYVSTLFASLYTFSTIYRKRKASRSASLEPWFGQHLSRNIYLSLLHLDPEDGKEKAPKVPDSVIRAALLRRAVEDIQRIIQIRTSKQALNGLLQRGSIGDDLAQRFARAEKEVEEELKDVVSEANALYPGWGQIIFQSANEINARAMLTEKLDEIEAKVDSEKEWWEKRRATIRKDFMQELDNEAGTATVSSTAPEIAAPTTDSPAKASVVASDDEAVLVDAGVPPAPAPSTPSGKKKKGNKK
ncbi:translocation protein-like protein [Microdochium trichocladiopsis]|uniref:Translocation protein-like protein n=1 Tax=Microdochium trichocladiopsis TaxID=1682393 RepID=A0A9P8YDR6_9PEZI|nr:translocation protein-like protein [Microdochium trichocladiopsis]KAH7035052.1 translocation protein-like protein [Microdochium trichocladiopsis]